MRLKPAVSSFLNLIFPPRCALCGAVAPSAGMVCPDCQRENPCVHAKKRIFVPEAGQTIVCKVPYEYNGKIRQSIIRFKFYGQLQSAAFFGMKVAEEFTENKDQFDLVTAVPVSAERLRQRGYNQSERIARVAAEKLEIPYKECLMKTADNKEQHKLEKKERKRNVQGVYSPIGQEIVGKRILLVDDIVTTGATLCACAEVLFAGGAKEVCCTAVAEVELS